MSTTVVAPSPSTPVPTAPTLNVAQETLQDLLYFGVLAASIYVTNPNSQAQLAKAEALLLALDPVATQLLGRL